MQKLYEKQEVLFAVLWIAAYCTVIAPIKQRFGIRSVWMLLALLVFAGSITAFVKASHAEEKYGLAGWPRDTKRFLYFLPMWILATGNLWDGFVPSCRGTELLISVLCMSLVGFVEEMLFRGFLFKALLAKEKAAAAIVVSSVTFGMGHIVNLFAGQASFETFVQIVFAISWGFILTMVCYKSGSIIPSILAHALIDAFSMFAADQEKAAWVYIGATIVVGVLYCIYLSRLQAPKLDSADACA